MAGAVDGIVRRLQRVAEHRVADLLGRDVGTFERVPRGDHAELGG